MKKKWNRTSVLAAVLAMTMLAGCGSTKVPETTAAPAAAETTAQETTAAESKAPETTAEESKAPETKASETGKAPETTAEKETAAPETTAEAAQKDAIEAAADPAEESTVHVTALKGPTAIGMIRILDAAENGGADGEVQYQVSLASQVDEVGPMLVKGEADIAAVPANLASVLYNKTEGKIQVLNINTLGVLYIVENGDTVHEAADLKGRTIYASGKGATPDYALNYILKGTGIAPAADVTVAWKSEHAECLAALLQDPEGIALLPQPFVTVAQTKSETLRPALDLTEEWNRLQKDADKASAMITGVTVVRKAFAEEHPELVEAFLRDEADSVQYVNADVPGAAALVGKFDIIPEAVAKKAIPACNIVYIDGEEMKDKLSGYLAVLEAENPQAVGGKLPADDFYFAK